MRRKFTRLTSVFLAVIIIFGIFTIVPFTASAVTCGDYEYEVLYDDTATIIAYNGSETDITIPSTLDGYNIISIDSQAFYEKNIVSVTIPESILFIGGGTFSDCTSLENVSISENLKAIYGFAFENCTSLKSITIPNSVDFIGDCAFSGCSSLAEINIPDSLCEIGMFAFYNTEWYNSKPDGVVYAGKVAYNYKGEMPENTSIKLKNGTKGIAKSAFYEQKNLIGITIPYSVVNICENAFDSCANLSNITIPNSVRNIESYAFIHCSSLTNITIPDSVTNIGFSVFSGCSNLASVTISENLQEISYGTFSNCSKLTSVSIPDSVIYIGVGAFAQCNNLADITIPDSVSSIGANAFLNTIWYSNQPDGVVYAGKVAYTYKGEMPKNASIKLMDGTKGIADKMFSNCTNLTEIKIPDSVINIGSYAFNGCTNLTSINIPNSVKNIGSSAFLDCTNMHSVTIPYSVEYIGWGAFGYIYETDYEKVDFTIYGYTGSEAEIYAKNYDFTFISIGDAPTPMLGDVNGDDKITIDDVTDIQKYIANMLNFTKEQNLLADVDKDEKISIDDVTLIQKHLAGLEVIE